MLCLRSKAVWGYDAAFIAACRAELTLTAADFERSRVQVAIDGGRVVGMVQLVIDGANAEIDKLFVEPALLRAGAGRLLFTWCLETARADGATRISVVGDPGAADFYRRMGMTDDGMEPSGSIPGRMLPKLRMALA